MVIHVEIYLAAKQLLREGVESFNTAELQEKIANMFGERKKGIPTFVTSACNASARNNDAFARIEQPPSKNLEGSYAFQISRAYDCYINYKVRYTELCDH